MGVYSSWDSFLLKCGGEVLLDKKNYLLYDQYYLAEDVVPFSQA